MNLEGCWWENCIWENHIKKNLKVAATSKLLHSFGMNNFVHLMYCGHKDLWFSTHTF